MSRGDCPDPGDRQKFDADRIARSLAHRGLFRRADRCRRFAGFLAGLLGVGGGIIVVPALYFILSALDVSEAVRMHVAVGTSLATIIVTSLISARSHAARGAVDMALLRQWAPGIIFGVLRRFRPCTADGRPDR